MAGKTLKALIKAAKRDGCEAPEGVGLDDIEFDDERKEQIFSQKLKGHQIERYSEFKAAAQTSLVIEDEEKVASEWLDFNEEEKEWIDGRSAEYDEDGDDEEERQDQIEEKKEDNREIQCKKEGTSPSMKLPCAIQMYKDAKTSKIVKREKKKSVGLIADEITAMTLNSAKLRRLLYQLLKMNNNFDPIKNIEKIADVMEYEQLLDVILNAIGRTDSIKGKMRRAAVFALALVGNAVLGSQKDTIRGTILSDDEGLSLANKWSYYGEIAQWVYGGSWGETEDEEDVIEDTKERSWKAKKAMLRSSFKDDDVPRVFLRDDERKEVIIAFRGTKGAQLALIDANFGTKEIKENGHVKEFVHRGMHLAATKAFKEWNSLLTDEEYTPTGYAMTVTGHSLGAGTASLFQRIAHKNGFDQMKCYGFATPAVFREKVSSSPSPKANSRSNSSKQKKPKRGKTPAGAVTKTAEREEPLLASALRDTAQELTTSIVLGSDLVPRLSYASATRILNGVRFLATQLKHPMRVLNVMHKLTLPTYIENQNQLLPAGRVYHFSRDMLNSNKPIIASRRREDFDRIFVSPYALTHHQMVFYNSMVKALETNDTNERQSRIAQVMREIWKTVEEDKNGETNE